MKKRLFVSGSTSGSVVVIKTATGPSTLFNMVVIVAPTASGNKNVGDVAALTRLTITVTVAYVNITDSEFDFDRSFSFFADYDSNLDLTTVENQLINEIFDQIILDIFNASVANW